MKKTLDEVIKAYEICMSDESKTTNCKGCPYADEEGEPLCLGEDKEDALHYLKEYKDAYGNVIASMNYHLRKIHELEQNDPLTWGELRTMEGKPVWVESVNGNFWAYIIDTNVELFHRILVIICNSGKRMNLYTREYGTWWQAYRKERE